MIPAESFAGRVLAAFSRRSPGSRPHPNSSTLREDLSELSAIAGLSMLLVLLAVVRFVLAVVGRVVDVGVYVVIGACVILAVAWFVAG